MWGPSARAEERRAAGGGGGVARECTKPEASPPVWAIPCRCLCSLFDFVSSTRQTGCLLLSSLNPSGPHQKCRPAVHLAAGLLLHKDLTPSATRRLRARPSSPPVTPTARCMIRVGRPTRDLPTPHISFHRSLVPVPALPALGRPAADARRHTGLWLCMTTPMRLA